MPAFFAYTVYMKQYTIRNIPAPLDRVARERAKKTDTSLNTTLLAALAAGLQVGEESAVYHDLDDLCGSWADDPECEAALATFAKIDRKLWR